MTEAFIALIGPITPQHSVAPAEEENSIGSVVLVYRAKLDEGGKKVVTPVNLTQVEDFPCALAPPPSPITQIIM